MIFEFNKLEKIFEQIKLSSKTNIFIIGGAAMLYHNIGRGQTKDIDVVLETKEDFDHFRNALKKAGFKTKAKPLTHGKLDIFEMLEQQDFRFDLFLKTVIKGFSLTKTMLKRADKIGNYKNLGVFICSKEDIFLFKSLSAERENDIEDSIHLIKSKIDWNTIFEELKAQTGLCKDQDKKKRLAYYFIERLEDLKEKGVVVPIEKKVHDFYNSI